ncbi:uncharacterized protein LOC143445365 [Clavelina lepadiformis]|uniref:uncharacterized protein LOC143445365 n=1 Tax=Clavelina lepadiformis TaxID=159417 RepID=UPI0040437983
MPANEMLSSSLGLRMLVVSYYVCLTTAYLIPPENGDESCKPYRSVLTKSLVRFAATYFIDNPPVGHRKVTELLDPNRLTHHTPIALFKEVYGEYVSPVDFSAAIQQILYSDPGRRLSLDDLDRISLRKNIVRLAQSSSYNLAREKFGALLYLSITDHAANCSSWASERCIKEHYQEKSEDAIHFELQRVRAEIKDENFRKFLNLGVGRTLAVVVDRSKDVAGDVNKLKTKIEQTLVQDLNETKHFPQDFVLIPFDDKGIGDVTITNSSTIFLKKLKMLQHNGQEADHVFALKGLLQAIENSKKDSTIFVMTNNFTREAELRHRIMAECNLKRISVHVIGNIGGNSPLGIDKSWEIFSNITQECDGSLRVIGQIDITDSIKRKLSTGTVEVPTTQKQTPYFTRCFPKQRCEFMYNVDPSINEINITVRDGDDFRQKTIQIANGVTSGLMSHGSGPDISTRATTATTFGQWSSAWCAPRWATCMIKVTAHSTTGFISTLARERRTEESNAVLEKLPGQGILDDNITVIIDVYGMQPGDRVTDVELLSKIFNDQRPIPLERRSASWSSLRVTPSSNLPSHLSIVVHGMLQSGALFTRTTDVELVNVEIRCANEVENIRQGENSIIKITLWNRGDVDYDLVMNIWDTHGFIDAPSWNIPLRGGGTRNLNINANVHSNTPQGIMSYVTITGKPNNFGNNMISKESCRIFVERARLPIVKSFQVDTSVAFSFAETQMTAVIFNNSPKESVASFQFYLPLRDAYLTNFTATFSGRTYVARIVPATREPTPSGAAEVFHVVDRPRRRYRFEQEDISGENIFVANSTLDPLETVVYQLTYQEQLHKQHGKFEYGVAIRMDHPIKEFGITVDIIDTNAVQNVNVLGLETDLSSTNLIQAKTASVELRDGAATVYYQPNINQQTTSSQFGLNGKFLLQYEVESTVGIGKMKVAGRDFVHFVSLAEPPMSRRMVFVLDTSGSMYGAKMKLLQLAVLDEISKLRVEDQFFILTFNNSINLWSPGRACQNSNGNRYPESSLVEASSFCKEDAGRFVKNELKTRGGSDILSAVQGALSILRQAVGHDHHPVADYIILLTDGHPTDGEINSEAIIRSVQLGGFAIHTIGFGALLDVDMVEEIAQKTGGNSLVVTGTDALLRMTEFFASISSPLMHDIEVKYDGDIVENFAPKKFFVLYEGSQLVISGNFKPGVTFGDDSSDSTRFRRNVNPVKVTVKGKKRSSALRFQQNAVPENLSRGLPQLSEITQKLQKHQEAQEMLKNLRMTGGDDEKRKLTSFAIEHNLVLPNITKFRVWRPRIATELPSSEVEEPIPVETDLMPTSITPVVARKFETEVIPPTVGASFSGVIGDPHVIAVLNENITICYYWDGDPEKVYNLLDDFIAGISIYAKTVEFKPTSKKYIGQMEFVFRTINASLLLNATGLSLLIKDGPPLRFNLQGQSTISQSGIQIDIKPLDPYCSQVFITLKNDVVFKIVAYSFRRHLHSTDHLDFSILRDNGLSSKATGIIGQHIALSKYKRAKKIFFKKETQETFLLYKNKRVKVRRRVTSKKLDRNKKIACWDVLNKDYLDAGETKMKQFFNLLQFG